MNLERARVAIYYCPAADDPLAAAGAAWLGRDPESGAPVPQPDLPGIAEVTQDARLYGFHATLKPPMRLRPGVRWKEVADATRAAVSRIAPFALPPFAVANLGGFLALRETTPSPPLQALSDACVAELDHLRAPPDAAEIARRRKAGLGVVQDALLLRWGYPYVFGAWHFHMTLTRRMTDAERARWRPAAEAHFAPALGAQRWLQQICLLTQPGPGQAFVIAERFALGAAATG